MSLMTRLFPKKEDGENASSDAARGESAAATPEQAGRAAGPAKAPRGGAQASPSAQKGQAAGHGTHGARPASNPPKGGAKNGAAAPAQNAARVASSASGVVTRNAANAPTAQHPAPAAAAHAKAPVPPARPPSPSAPTLPAGYRAPAPSAPVVPGAYRPPQPSSPGVSARQAPPAPAHPAPAGSRVPAVPASARSGAFQEVAPEKLHEAVDDAFGSIVSRPPIPGATTATPYVAADEPTLTFGEEAASTPEVQVGQSDVHELFAEIAATQMKQVRDAMIGLKWGEPVASWVPVCIPMIVSLRRAADGMQLPELCQRLDAFRTALQAAGDALADPVVAGKNALAAYERLIELMPQAFTLEGDRTERESIIVQALLLQVPGIHKLAIDKIYAAGLTTLAAFGSANTGDVAAAAGLDPDLATAIVARFESYRRSQTTKSEADAHEAQWAELARRVAHVREVHEAFEKASHDWSDHGARKRTLRREREVALLDVQVALARLGEVDQIAKLDRAPFAAKIGLLEAHLRDHAKPPPSHSL